MPPADESPTDDAATDTASPDGESQAADTDGTADADDTVSPDDGLTDVGADVSGADVSDGDGEVVAAVVRSRPPPDATPRWFEFLVAAGATGVLSYGLVSLVLAMLAAYALLPALAGGSLLWAVLLWSAWRGLRPLDGARPGWNGSTVAAALAILLAGGAFGWYGFAPSEHVLTDRDPAIYVNAAIWISSEGRLDAPDAREAFDGVDDVGFNSPGIYPTRDGLQFQFNHFTAALGAFAYDIGGEWALFRFTGAVAAFGLLAVYAVAVRALRRPFFALVVPVVVGCSLPLLVLARDVYSEPNLLLAVWTAAMLAATFWDRPRRSLAVVTGFVIGMLAVIRVESFLYLAAFASLAAFAVVLGRPSVRRAVPWAALAVVPGVAVGLLDFYLFTGGYSSVEDGIGKQSAQAIGFSLVVAVAAPLLLLLWRRFDGVAARVRRHRSGLGVTLGTLVTLGLGAWWILRPLVAVDRSSAARWGVLGTIQESEGAVVDLHRTYYEQSVNWVAWYIGPITMALGLVGLGFMTARLLRGRLDPVLVAALALFSTGGLAYLIAPNITPDQVWATRRLVPIVFVVVVLAAVVLIEYLVELTSPWAGPALRLTGALVLIVPVALTTAPVPLPAEQPGVFGAVEEVCDLLDDDDMVLVVDDVGQILLMPPLRGVCGVPVGHVLRGVDDPEESIDDARRRADELGRDLVLVATDLRFLELYESDAERLVETVTIPTNTHEVKRSLLGPPRRYLRDGEQFFVPRDLEVHLLRPDPRA